MFDNLPRWPEMGNKKSMLFLKYCGRVMKNRRRKKKKLAGNVSDDQTWGSIFSRSS